MELPADEMNASIRAHDEFLGRFIGMIPADLYAHAVSEDNQPVLQQYKQHRKMPLSAEDRKALSKQRKVQKYAQSVSVINEAPDSSSSAASAKDIDELKRRLQERILSMKMKRMSQQQDRATGKRKRHEKNIADSTDFDSTGPHLEQNSGQSGTQRIRRKGVPVVLKGVDAEVRCASNSAAEIGAALVDDANSVSSLGSGINSSGRAVHSAIPADLQFNLIAQSAVAAGNDAKGAGKKETKLQRLQRLLREAERKRKRMKDLSGDSGSYQQLHGEKWNDVLKSAAGERVLVVGSNSIEGSEGKLKKALKKRDKKKMKSAEQWSERLRQQQEAKQEKQTRREENLEQRRVKNKGLLPSPTELRSNRAGFEGKKGDGMYLNNNSRK